ncbi:MerR family transcriptional regulator [Janthinobacterium fluminis]|uniref:MerR family transcriptional regulator n=1 Tax=Janthinobacterium fluminis TaxID=2987524 RepID=A0ABT5K4Z4_9BURK|nr:MerR family transcriptional regulator [Janthinobacterium fluminis]MDC8759816.1 MerR family transcriptional regulator [Janthinobacterium fluminis]
MDTDNPPFPVCSTISDVERDTGLAKETLRVWERRYAFPQPQRDAFGERLYSAEQVRKLRLVKRLLDLGFRPGKIIGHSSDALQALAARHSAAAAPDDPRLHACLALCQAYQTDALRAALSQALLEMGLRHFVTDLVAPLTTRVGASWACGQLAVYGEHLFTETLQMVLRTAIFLTQQADRPGLAAPRILLTTLPQERHGLSLLMVEALCVADGAHCISLGVQTPLQDIVEAAHTLRADIVALSFSSCNNTRQAQDGLNGLRAGLPAAVELWAGGAAMAPMKRRPASVHVLDLPQVAGALADWRRRRAKSCQIP